MLKGKQKSLDVMVEQARLFEGRAQASGLDKAAWVKASGEWAKLAGLVGRSPKLAKSPEYFDAWWHVAFCQARQGRSSRRGQDPQGHHDPEQGRRLPRDEEALRRTPPRSLSMNWTGPPPRRNQPHPISAPTEDPPVTASRRASAAPAIVLLLSLASPARADTLTTLPDAAGKTRKVAGSVTEESPTEVVIGTQKVAVPEIDTIDYNGSPPSLTIAEQREVNGKLAEAIAEYQKAEAAASEKPFIAQAIQFRRLGLLATTSPADAIKGLDAFVRSNLRSRHRGPALLLLIRLTLDAKDYAKAEAAATQLRDVPWARDRADVVKARILTYRGKPAEAESALAKLIGSAGVDTPGGRDARLALAEALAAQKKFPEAEAAAREVIKAALPEDATAQGPAYNDLGDILRAAGRPKDALFAYLHTDLLYSRNKDEHARALAALAQVCRELKRDDRATEALDRLKAEYPTSPWLASAGGGK